MGLVATAQRYSLLNLTGQRYHRRRNRLVSQQALRASPMLQLTFRGSDSGQLLQNLDGRDPAKGDHPIIANGCQWGKSDLSVRGNEVNEFEKGA